MSKLLEQAVEHFYQNPPRITGRSMPIPAPQQAALNLPREADLLADRVHRNISVSVGELANTLYPGVTIDYARPIDWDDAMAARGIETRGRFVWGYRKDQTDISGRPLPLTWEALMDLAAITRWLR